MPIRKPKRTLCHHCAVTLGREDRDHYGYQCHACVVREHELILMLATDPDHPDVEWLDGSPVDLGFPARSREPTPT